MDQALNSQKTPHTSPLRASYGMSFVSILMKNDRVIKGFYCIYIHIFMNLIAEIKMNIEILSVWVECLMQWRGEFRKKKTMIKYIASSDNRSSIVRCQAIICTNDNLLDPYDHISVTIEPHYKNPFKNMNWKILSS